MTKSSQEIEYNLKPKKKQNKHCRFLSMPFKALAFFADVKLTKLSRFNANESQLNNSIRFFFLYVVDA